MISRDWLMEQVQTAARVLARVLMLKELKQYEAALEAIHQSGKDFFGLNYEAIHLLSDAQMTDVLKSDGAWNVDRLKILAGLLKAESEVLEVQNRNYSNCRCKALSLYLEAFFLDSALPSNEVDSFLQFEDPDSFPTYLKDKVTHYHEIKGHEK